MKKIQFASDIHLGYQDQNFDFPVTDSDVLILAGDVCVGFRAIEFAQLIADRHGKPVLFVAGNHEYYMNDYQKLHQRFRDFSDKSENVFFLDCDVFELEGVRFLGTTLWTDYLLGGHYAQDDLMYVAGNSLNDHVYINYGDEGAFKPSHALAIHKNARAFLEAELAKDYDGKTVVITHHAPSLRCVHPKFGINKVAGAFMSDCDDLIEMADLWVYGHVHANTEANLRQVSNFIPKSTLGSPAKPYVFWYRMWLGMV